jgi:hypothetical protein
MGDAEGVRMGEPVWDDGGEPACQPARPAFGKWHCKREIRAIQRPAARSRR